MKIGMFALVNNKNRMYEQYKNNQSKKQNAQSIKACKQYNLIFI